MFIERLWDCFITNVVISPLESIVVMFIDSSDKYEIHIKYNNTI